MSFVETNEEEFVEVKVELNEESVQSPASTLNSGNEEQRISPSSASSARATINSPVNVQRKKITLGGATSPKPGEFFVSLRGLDGQPTPVKRAGRKAWHGKPVPKSATHTRLVY